MHKISGLNLCNFYSNFYLIKCGGPGIIENSTRIVRARAARTKKKECRTYSVALFLLVEVIPLSSTPPELFSRPKGDRLKRGGSLLLVGCHYFELVDFN